MLYNVGPLQIRVWPFNVDKVETEVSGNYAEKNVLGRRPPLEAVGEGPETLTLGGKLFPFKLGGLSELELAREITRRQMSVNVMRGDGYWLGFYVIETVGTNETFLHANGVAQVVEHTLKLKRDDPPSALDFFDLFMGFFG